MNGDGFSTPEDRLRAAGAQFTAGPAAEAPEFSDDALALAFTAQHEGELLFVPEWGHWLRWDGTRWARDTTLAVRELVRLVCREHAANAVSEHVGRGIASAQRVLAVERMARTDRQHAREASAFDVDPWVLNTPAGVVDLRSGVMQPRRRSDLVTKVTAVAPGGACARWLRFLNEITQGDAEMVAYLHRWCGYAMSGDTSAHAFLFLYGPGGNGKSVLLNTLAHVLGDYATTADLELFNAGSGNSHSTGIADLRGARLVLAQETEQGRALAEAKIKAMTGGDKIKARFMRQDFFKFAPLFKIMMAGNHRPVIRNPDDAMRRRLHLLAMTYKPPAPDRELQAALLAEAPGILAWAIQGCIAWQREGLGSCEAMTTATADYFAEQDLLAQWLAERCEPVRNSEVPSSALFRDWQAWAGEHGEQPGTGKAFSAALERFHSKRRTKEGMMFVGLRLKPSATGVL
jgi:putative DNA primase/helicase